MRALLPLTLGCLGALAAGCGDATPGVPASSVGPAASTATPVPTTAGPVSVTLRHLPAGLAVIGINDEVRQLSVEVRVAGLSPGSTHAARLIDGTCAHPGTVLHPLEPLVADGGGIGDATTTVANVTETAIPRAGWSLAVFTGAAEIMCGDLVNEAGQTVITAGIAVVVPPGGPDPGAAGSATLSVTGGALKVVVDVTGLTPGSVHAAQLRRGSCEGQRAVLHPLTALTADPAGHAVSTTVIPGVTTIPLDGWFVGVSPPAVLDPVVCGDVGR
jgi:hypothetical protein